MADTAAERLAASLYPDRWGAIDNDGNRACWWCLCTVHPTVAQLHDQWHLAMWEADRG